jgi:putative methionine-R-sulfoxide reductase with GAF domain
MFGVGQRRVKVTRGRQSPHARRLALEPLEDRTLLAIGDLLGSLVDPSTIEVEAGSRFGYSIAVNGDLTVVGTPMTDNPANDTYSIGHAYVFESSTGHLVATLENPAPATSEFFGCSVAISGHTAVVGALYDDAGADDAGSAYVFDVTTGNLVATLANPAPSADDYFGCSVAISGDTVVVGAYGDDVSTTDAGAAYVFNATTGSLIHTLTNPTPANDDRFGYSVSLSGSIAIVGAYNDDTLATNSGAAYVFDTSTGGLVRTLTHSSPASADLFGYSVAISGNTAVVGVRQDDTGAANAGGACVYNTSTGVLLQTLTNPSPAQNDFFGHSVAVSGSTVAVGAWTDDTGGTDSGAAYVFDAVTGSLVRTLDNPAPAAYDNFGVAVAVSGDTAAVAAYLDDTDAVDAGSAYLFSVSSGSLFRTYGNATPSTDDHFGRAVAVSGNRAVVGAYHEDTGGINCGTAYVYDVAASQLLWTVVNPTPEINDLFGHSVAISDSTLVIGADQDNTGADDAGAAYIFDASTGALRYTLTNPAPASDDFFGRSVAVSGNIAVVGAPYDDTTVTDAGTVYVFDVSTGALLRTLANPAPGTGDNFGISVAVRGNTIVVGAYSDDLNATDSGTAYVFDASTGELRCTLVNPTPASSDGFGWTVAVSESTVAVGAPWDDTGSFGSGSAYIFSASTGTLLQTLANPGPAAGDNFGYGTAVSGNTVVVGTPCDDTGAANTGAVYAFDIPTGTLIGTLVNPTPEAGDWFGLAVDIANGVGLVSAMYDDTRKPNGGAAYLFDCNQAPSALELAGSSVAENAASGTTIGSLTTTDPDPDESFVYTLVDSAGGRFKIVGSQLQVDAGALLDYETATSHTITVRTTDHAGSGASFEQQFVITLANVNEAPTHLALDTASVAENAAANAAVGNLSCTDPDAGDTVTYTLLDSAGGRFQIAGYQIQVADGMLLDYEAATSHTIRVRATDQGGTGLSYEQPLIITVTNVDEPPADVLLTGTTVAENAAAGTPVGTLTTDDLEGDRCEYTLIDSAGGRLKIVGNQLQVDNGSLLDYETGTSHSITVRATQIGGSAASLDRQFVITVTDANDAPTHIALDGATVAENAGPGTRVGTLSSTDPDAGDTASYSLVDSAGGRFKIAGTQLQVNTAAFDFETAPSLTVRVRVTDHGGASHEQQFTITVTDANEPPTAVALSGTGVPENAAADTVVGSLTASDPDANDTFTYQLTGDAEGRFKLQGHQILVADGARLDYEAAGSHVVSVKATDAGGLAFEQQLTVTLTNVNETPTHIALDGATVAENSAAGSLVGRLSTTDPDAGDTFTYRLTDDAGGRFKIEGDRLLVANCRLLDYETNATHGISVVVTDAGGLSFEQPLTVTVTDVHDGDSVAVFNPTTSMFYLRGQNVSGPADYTFGYGEGGDWQTLVGDWDGDGSTGVGLYDPESSTFYLTNAYQFGFAEHTFGYGEPGAGWIPLVGDWDGNGTAGVGLYNPHSSTFYLTDSLATGFAQYTFGYGEPGAGWQTLVGDWDGDGHDGVGLFAPTSSTFYLTNALVGGFAQCTFGYGNPDAGWEPMVGDWDGNGASGVALYDPAGATLYVTNTLQSGFAEHTFGYGQPGAGWDLIVGDWDGNGSTGVGLYDASSATFYLTSDMIAGTTQSTVRITEAGSGWVPLAGCWTRFEPPLSAAAIDQIDLADLAAEELLGLGHDRRADA